MVVFKLRTKIEVVIALLMLIVVATITAVSVTRTITESGDNIETFIRNSNGKYWSVSESNLQLALNSIGVGSNAHGGTVDLPGNITLTINTGIVLADNCILDLHGSVLDVRSNVDALTMAPGSCLQHGTIITTNYGGTYTKAAICFDGTQHYWGGNAIVQNMYLVGSLNQGSGIEYRLDTQGDIASFTTCRDIQIFQFKYGILMNVTGGAETGPVTYANGNIFSNIYIIYPQYDIYLNRNSAIANHNQVGVDGNQFNDIQIETGTNTIRAIYAEGRYNVFDNIFVWDWSLSGQQYAFEFPSDSQYSFLTYQVDANTGVQSNNRYISNGTSNYRQDLRNGEYAMKTFSQASEPDIPTDTMAFWCDTDAAGGPKYYIIQDFNGTQKKAELT